MLIDILKLSTVNTPMTTFYTAKPTIHIDRVGSDKCGRRIFVIRQYY